MCSCDKTQNHLIITVTEQLLLTCYAHSITIKNENVSYLTVFVKSVCEQMAASTKPAGFVVWHKQRPLVTSHFSWTQQNQWG